MDDDQSKIIDSDPDNNSEEIRHAYQKGFRSAIASGAKSLRDETKDYETLAAEFPPEYAHKLGEIFRMGFRTGQYKLLSGNSGILEIMLKNVEKMDW